MDKERENSFLKRFTSALESLPFDLKVVADVLSEPDMPESARAIAAATMIHVLAAKDGHFEPALRHAEDVVLVKLALARILREGGEVAEAFRARHSDTYETLAEDLALFRAVLGAQVVDWMDNRWPTLLKAVHAKKTVRMYLEDEALSSTLYEEVVEFATEYPVAEGSLDGRLKHAQPIVDHLTRKLEQDRLRITH